MSVAGFAGQLWPLTAEIEALFGDWLPRLRAALGSLGTPRHADPMGEPDGYGGLARRGAWERLLVSEWAIADAVPDEFIRRAAMREQLFLELSHVAPVVAPVTRVWFDCGPDQLGAPRLAHLALLIVLRRRVDEAGGVLLWSTLHEPERFVDELDPDQLLASRTSTRAMPTLDGDGERWVVGRACPGATPIVITEGDGCLYVQVRGRTIELQLPSLREVGRMLTFPRATARASLIARRHGGRIDALRFTAGGGTLLIRVGGAVHAFAVPQTVRAHAKRKVTYDAEGSIAGVTQNRQRLAVLRRHGDQAKLRTSSGTWSMPWPEGVACAEGLPWMVVLPRTLQGAAQHERRAVIFRDAEGVLHVLDFLLQECVQVGRSDTEVFVVDGVLVWVNGQTAMRLVPGRLPACSIQTLVDYGWDEQPSPVWVQHLCVQYHKLLAVQRAHQGWAVAELLGFGQPLRSVHIDASEWMVGGLVLPEKTLVTVGDGGLWRHTESGAQRFATPDDVDQIACGGREEGLVAWSTRAGTILIYTLTGRKLLEFLLDDLL